ncbi:MAG: glycosyltransferase family 4 protein, partial [Coriobacteriia bacterium]|nr:glycosyltransferase family 4 protein [Coriobacteriia bacterium]
MFTTRAWHARRLANRHPWAPPGVDVHMLNVRYENRMGAARRFSAFAGYAVRAVAAALRRDPPDLVVGSSTPLTVAVAAALTAVRYRIPWIFEVRDLWPDFPIQMGAVPGRLSQSALYALEHVLYRHAARIVTLSPDMETHVRRYVSLPDKVRTIHYGVDLDEAETVRGRDRTGLFDSFGLDDRRVILYAGRFGRANAIPTLLDAARLLSGRDDVRFVFAGDGYHEDDIRTAADALTNVLLLPPQPRHRALMLFRLATVSITSFIDLPVLSANAPAKLSDSLACGTPVIVTNDG